jgi:hypothetical protein
MWRSLTIHYGETWRMSLSTTSCFASVRLPTYSSTLTPTFYYVIDAHCNSNMLIGKWMTPP